MVARGWSEAQKRAYLIADNKLGLNAGWNEELLRIEMADLMTMGFELPLMGFSERELSALNASGNPGGRQQHWAEWEFTAITNI